MFSFCLFKESKQFSLPYSFNFLLLVEGLKFQFLVNESYFFINQQFIKEKKKNQNSFKKKKKKQITL